MKSPACDRGIVWVALYSFSCVSPHSLMLLRQMTVSQLTWMLTVEMTVFARWLPAAGRCCSTSITSCTPAAMPLLCSTSESPLSVSSMMMHLLIVSWSLEALRHSNGHCEGVQGCTPSGPNWTKIHAIYFMSFFRSQIPTVSECDQTALTWPRYSCFPPSDGKSLSLEDLWSSVTPCFRRRLQRSPLNTITLQVNMEQADPRTSISWSSSVKLEYVCVAGAPPAGTAFLYASSM